MNQDVIVGMLVGLAAVCTGALFVLLALWWREAHGGGGRPGDGYETIPPAPPDEPVWEVPDHVPAEWSREAA